jgi:NADH dehydrogenase (ubiquinone) 1 alpha subcomplex subunit 5
MFKTLAQRAAAHAAASQTVTQAVKRTKLTTGIVGLEVHPEPCKTLKSLYNHTLQSLAALPPNSVYRQSVEALTSHRLALVQKAGDGNDEAAIEQLEAAIDQGSIENVISVAEDELALVHKMKEWEAWGELQEPAPPGQWEYFDVPRMSSRSE